MKKYQVLGFAVVVALIFMSGCAKTFKEGSQTAASIQSVEQEARLGREKVNTAVANLDNLFNNQAGDIKKQFEAYSKSIDDLESQAKVVRKRVDAMAAKKTEYLDQWDTQMATIESEAVRQTAEQRRQSVEKMFDSVQSEMDAAGQAYQPFISNLNDIRTAMNMDLNRNGLSAMKPIADKAKANSSIINGRLDTAISVLSEAAKALSASGG